MTPVLDSPALRWAAFALLVLLTASRAPLLIQEPRLIAEEASVYLVYARDHGVLSTLLLVPTSEGPAGYLHLAANLAALLETRVFALEHAAAVSTALAFLLQLVPFALVLWGRSVAWTSTRRRLVCCGLLLVAPAISPSVWLSIINSQVFCGISSLILLLEDLPSASPRRRRLYRCLLLLNGLSGPYTALLAPGFLWRSLRLKSREAWIQTALVSATGALQLLCYVAAALGSEQIPDRLTPLGLATGLSSVLVFHVFGAFLGSELAALVAAPLGLVVRVDRSVATGAMSPEALIVATAGLLLWGIWLARARRSWVMTALLIEFVAVSASVSFLAHGLPWHRYAVVPGTVLLLSVLLGGWESKETLRRTACRALLAVALVCGLATFWRDAPMRVDDFSVTHFGDAPGRPDWRREVAAWRRDPAHVLRVWPFAGGRSWKAYLPQPGDFERVRLEPTGDWRLIALRKPVERRVRILDPPGDYRVQVAGTASAGPTELDLRIRLVGGEPDFRTLARGQIRFLGAKGRFETRLNPGYLKQRADSTGQPRFVVLRLHPIPERGVRVVVDRIAVVPRVIGLLDRWWLPRRDPAGGGRAKAGAGDPGR